MAGTVLPDKFVNAVISLAARAPESLHWSGALLEALCGLVCATEHSISMAILHP